ncbi:hypothetical protein QFC21_005056 [Naganishia friedmannii]|uniref:Uncharacterized protein n=1 Tax=Naganishia friedmannii TaxID=89922 RepID=A0ACC2VCH0_9TREE|nr:hypothetical protein QFC21_005056 [Naganishia friedmannii]
MAANILSAATSTLGFLAGAATAAAGKPSSLSAYTINTTSDGGGSSTTGASVTVNQREDRGFTVGLWKVLRATHKTTKRPVSIWTYDRRSSSSSSAGEHQVVEALKKEATSLSKLRHPDLLHMIEPLEESRAGMTFVTEPVVGCLAGVLKGNQRGRKEEVEEELDEVEIQKGVLQLAKALSFLHNQAKLVHLNINPEAIVINTKGDWKLSGLGMTLPLSHSTSAAAGGGNGWVYPEFDNRLPASVQWKFDYLAPEYVLDSLLAPSNDLYALGCLLYAVHLAGGNPPLRCRDSVQGLRECVERELVTGKWMGGAKWTQAGEDLRDILSKLITRTPQTRLSLPSLPSHPYFSSLAISTLNFLDPTSFSSKSREEKATFLKGLLRVLPGFSDKLRRRKVLPGLLDEMKDTYLLPFLLPNVFLICKSIPTEEFTRQVLPNLKPLFGLKDSPQNLIGERVALTGQGTRKRVADDADGLCDVALLENLQLFKDKTTAAQFKEDVMPLIYNSLECDHPPVQEKALNAIPALCDALPYDVLEQVLLVKVAILFTKTRILSVKVCTLECFLAMVPILTQMATLNVQEAMGMKVDREAVAGLVLPQLWTMSMGPLLNVDQFSKFMSVIKFLGARVEREHIDHLRSIRHAEAQTASLGLHNSGWELGGGGHESSEVDFETLVGRSSGAGTPHGGGGGVPAGSPSILDDTWGNDMAWLQPSRPAHPTMDSLSLQASHLPAPTRAPVPRPPTMNGSKLNGRPVPASKFDRSAFPMDATSATTPPTFSPPTIPFVNTLSPLVPTPRTNGIGANGTAPQKGPDYNISLAPLAPTSTNTGLQTAPPSWSTSTPSFAAPAQSTLPPGFGSGMLQPVVKPQWKSAPGKTTDWGDFDPLK